MSTLASRLALLLLLAAAVQAVPPPTWLFPVPSTELQPPPPPQADDDSIPMPSWADVMAKVPDPATSEDEAGAEAAVGSWGDVLPPPEPSDELQPPPAPASSADIFPADPEAADVDILKVAPKLPAASAPAEEVPSGPAVDLQLEDQEYVKAPSKEVKYKPQKPAAPDSKQALLKVSLPQFPKKYQPELHKAEGGAKKNLSPKLAVPEQEVAESSFAGVAVGTGEQHLGGAGHLSGGGERVEFQMHGQNGPSSYKFGFDTGNVHNRQFRYEERDAHGHVKGHYGFYDKSGKLQIVNYSADPHTGYHAEPGVVG